MPQKLFVLGMPGSGKSTIARYIVEHIRRNHTEWIATRLNDYDILHDMFMQDKAQKYFHPVAHKGFLVRHPFTYDKALKLLEQAVESTNYPDDELIVIEFARSDYIHAFSNFSSTFLQDAFFLFLDVDINVGMKRVRNRVRHPHSTDDHFVPRRTIEVYAQKNTAKNVLEVIQHLVQRYDIEPQRIKTLKNGRSKRKFEIPVSTLIKKIRHYTLKDKKEAIIEVPKGISGN